MALLCSACAGPQIRELGTAAAVPAAVSAFGNALAEKTGDAALAQAAQVPRTDPEAEALLDAVRRSANAPFVLGNQVRALIDGPQTLDAIRAAIGNARHHIHLETYIFADDEVGQQMATQLKAKRAQGVMVRIIYDAVGSVSTPRAFFDDLRAHGIEVQAYRPFSATNTLFFWRLNNRDHRKIVVVDGRVGFTGGINVSAAYARSSASKPGPEAGLLEGWRDTHVRIEGPATHQLQALFLSTWRQAGGELVAEAEEFYPGPVPVGGEPVAIVASGTDLSEASVYATYLTLVRMAKTRVWLTQAYFAPNRQLRDALIEAVRRGVDVRIIVPGFTDSGLILHAARANYDELLRNGVRLFEQRDALLHAKTAVIDGMVSMVGSANLDMRSFIHNNEANAIVISRDFGKVLESAFDRDAQASRELNLTEWRHRGVLPRLKEMGSRLFSYWL